MLKTLEEIFETGKIQRPSGEYIDIHGNTSKDQCIFLQEIFDQIKPKKSLEIGLMYGTSTMSILEKHRDHNNEKSSHLIIEPVDWGGVAEYNIEKEGLTDYADIRRFKSHDILPKLYYVQHRVQYVYIDTVKLFDTVMQDFFFIDKILDIGGVVIFDDCIVWPGIQRVARFVNTLPHYKILEGHRRVIISTKGKRLLKLIKSVMFKTNRELFYPYIRLQTDEELGLNYRCIAFQKIDNDKRNWDWDKAI